MYGVIPLVLYKLFIIYQWNGWKYLYFMDGYICSAFYLFIELIMNKYTECTVNVFIHKMQITSSVLLINYK